jgi:hypothetical protein
VSYAAEQGEAAETIAQALRNEGHEVFFDKASLRASAGYNERIREAIYACDRFIFLASRSALQAGRYTLTEVELVKHRWPSAQGRVLTFLTEPDLKEAELPIYLRSVHVERIAGNPPAQVAAAVDRMRGLRPQCKWALSLLGALAVGSITMLFALVVIDGLPQETVSEVALLPLRYVHFRPRANPATVNTWTESPVTITLNVVHSHGGPMKPTVQIVEQQVLLVIGAMSAMFDSAYIVEIKSDDPCADWLCRQGNAKAETVERGNTLSRETLFLPSATGGISWEKFIDAVVEGAATASATVELRSRIRLPGGKETIMTERCVIDLAASRVQFAKLGYRKERDPRPYFWQPFCEKASAAAG